MLFGNFALLNKYYITLCTLVHLYGRADLHKPNHDSIANGQADELREVVPELFDEERMKKKWTLIQDALRWG